MSAGGDSRIIGDKHGRPWMMGIRHPRKENAVVTVLPLSNSAISTSGDYERFFMEEGTRHHHILQPKSGEAVKGMWSVSVIGPNTTTTDALSTSVFVLGTKEGMRLIESMPGFDAILIDSNAKMHITSGLSAPEKPR